MSIISEEDPKLLNRQLRDKFLNNGMDSLSDAELLCLLLSYNEKRNAGQMAEMLLNKFGSLRNIMTADAGILKRTGLKEASVVLLKMIPDLAIRRRSSALVKTVIDSSEAAIEYFSKYFSSLHIEQLIAAAISKKMKIIRKPVVIASGNDVCMEFSCRNIIDFALSYKADIIIIAHNHPDCSAEPSDDDIRSTRHIIRSLAGLGITLADHIIIGRGSAVSMRRNCPDVKFKDDLSYL